MVHSNHPGFIPTHSNSNPLTRKEFFDRTYYAALGRLNGRPYALAVAAGSDGQGAAGQMARICQGWRAAVLGHPGGGGGGGGVRKAELTS